MKTFLTAVMRSPRLAVLMAALVGAIVVPAALMAWGPSDRPTYTMANPADHVTFNSITDNPDMGDERNFVRIREAGVGNYGDEVNVEPGKEYEVEVFYHNNAATIYNDEEHQGVGIAQDAMARVEMPATAKAGEQVHITGYVSASNAQPQQVWDEAYMKADRDVALRYVGGSAKFKTLGAIDGQDVPETLYTTGASLGYDAQDGVVPGCNQYEGLVVFRVKVVAPDFSVEKTVSKVGANAFSKSINVNPGDEVEYKIQYKNTGSVAQTDVVVKDQLPAGVSYVPGSTLLANSGTGGQWTNLSDDNITAGPGINIGDYDPESNAFVKFKAKIADADQLPKCGVNELVNTATVDTANGSLDDTAVVTVTKPCAEVPGELPQTGPADGIMAMIGLSALAAGLAYAVRSTRVRNLLRG